LLKVLEVDLAYQTAILEAPTGEKASLSIGDVVGIERAIVKEIRPMVIILHHDPDNNGQRANILIPVIRVGTSTASSTE